MPLLNKIVVVPTTVNTTGAAKNVSAISGKGRKIQYDGTALDVIDLYGGDDALGTRLRFVMKLGPIASTGFTYEVPDSCLSYAARLISGTGGGVLSVYGEPVDPDAEGEAATFDATTIANMASGGVIGDAVDTVDVAAAFRVNQTTAGQTVTLPAPTVPTASRLVTVSNTGSVVFMFYAAYLAVGDSVIMVWNGTTWARGGALIDGGNARGALIKVGASDANALALVTDGQQRLNVTAAGDVGIGVTVPKAKVHNAGSTILGFGATVADLATGGVIGTAAETVDAYSGIAINQTTASQTPTLPAPTDTTAGRFFTVANVGSVSFTLLGKTVTVAATPQTAAATCLWNGTAWVIP
jgi:hypothetical protein